MNEPLDKDTIMALLASGRGTKTKVLERDISTWFTLNHVRSDDGCENPNCEDPRDKDDSGRNIVSKVEGQLMCRYCFLHGWLKQ